MWLIRLTRNSSAGPTLSMKIDPSLIRPVRVVCQTLDAMSWVALLGAALYYHPWLSITLIGVAITLIGVIVRLRRQT